VGTQPEEATTVTMSTSPVHVDAILDPAVSRWQWLFKWLLVIPHYVVLVFLWIAFVVLSVVAFFAILFTGRYPRSIFDFNVGVLRWTWRVSYYAYGALATDQYPPFSLQERPDYPAHLEIDYPEHLSRGLVLVKSWLLAIPHYLVLALFLGGAGYTVGGADDAAQEPWLWSWGLLGVLVAVAAVVLLFTGRYPQSVFDLVLGLNRWALRVAAYAGLMTDQYPPFRLDQGGRDPAVTALTTPPGPASGPPAGPPSGLDPSRSGSPGPGPAAHPGPSGWTAGRVIALVVGALVVVGSLGLGTAGVALAVAEGTMRDDAGFLMSGDERLTTDTFALASTNIELQADTPADVVPEALLGDAKVSATSQSGDPLFLGLAATEDVEGYLADVRHDTVLDLVGPEYRESGSRAPSGPPEAEDFWVVSASGTGEQSVVWEPRDGDWTVVVMNADGSAGLDADMAAGAELPVLEWVVAVLLVLAGIGLVLGAVIITLAVRAAGRR
jgi:hypothetical protein